MDQAERHEASGDNAAPAASLEEGRPAKKINTKLIIIIGLAFTVVVISVLTGVIITLLNRVPEPIIYTERDGGRGIVAMPENIDEIRSQLAQPVPDGYFETRMNIEWVFKTSKTASDNAFVANAVNNTRMIYFDLLLTDTQELLYTSPYIPVGAELTGFALDAQLSAGTYQAIVLYHLVDDDFNEITQLSVGVTVHILG